MKRNSDTKIDTESDAKSERTKRALEILKVIKEKKEGLTAERLVGLHVELQQLAYDEGVERKIFKFSEWLSKYKKYDTDIFNHFLQWLAISFWEPEAVFVVKSGSKIYQDRNILKKIFKQGVEIKESRGTQNDEQKIKEKKSDNDKNGKGKKIKAKGISISITRK